MRNLLSIILSLLRVSCSTKNKPTYKVTTTVSPTEGGTITLNPSYVVYSGGETVTITGTPSNGWRFVRWEGDWSGETNPSTITMNKDYTVVGIFVKRNYPLTIEVEGYGEVLERVIQQKTTENPYKTVVELTPVLDENYEFVEWGGDLSGSEVPKTITVDGEKTVVAKFRHILEGRKLQRVDSSLSLGGSSTSFETYTYDSNENLIEFIYYNSEGNVVFRYVYYYDSNNNLIEQINYNSNGGVSLRTVNSEVV
jgi:hypothetical protein